MCLRRGGTISSIVTGTKGYLHDLPQGGMEIPCKLKFSCKCDDTKGLQKIKALPTEDLIDGDHAKILLDALMPSYNGFVDLEPGSSGSSLSGTLDLQANGDSEVWVRYDHRRLNLNDKIILQRGNELSEKHIQFAQKLIKE